MKDRKPEIIDAVIKIMAVKGRRFNTAELAQSLGHGQSRFLYHYYGSRYDMECAAVEHVVDTFSPVDPDYVAVVMQASVSPDLKHLVPVEVLVEAASAHIEERMAS